MCEINVSPWGWWYIISHQYTGSVLVKIFKFSKHCLRIKTRYRLLLTSATFCQRTQLQPTINTGKRHHDDVIKWKQFPRYWPFVRGIHRSPVNSLHKGQWRGAFDVFFDLCRNKRLNKQSRGWWFERQSCPLWRHCNALGVLIEPEVGSY